MSLPLLHNAFLYFASSAAQVWAALMVFQVLLMRDLCLYRDEEEAAFVSEGRGWLGVLLAPENKINLSASNELGVDIAGTLVRTAKGDEDAELRLLRAVAARGFFRQRQIGGTVDGLTYTADELQSRIDKLVQRIETFTANYPEPQEAFKTGIASLALNLASLPIYAFIGDNPRSLIGLLGALAIANLALGWRFAHHCRRALVCY